MSPDEAAAWMASEVRSAGFLDHEQVIAHLIDDDESLIAYNDAGNLKVSRAVLDAFARLRPVDIVWSRSNRHWRLREDGDEASRSAH